MNKVQLEGMCSNATLHPIVASVSFILDSNRTQLSNILLLRLIRSRTGSAQRTLAPEESQLILAGFAYRRFYSSYLDRVPYVSCKCPFTYLLDELHLWRLD